MLQKNDIQKCQSCCQAFSSCEENSIFPLANLIDIKNHSKLIYPNLKLFYMIKKIDTIFNNNVKKNNDVYEKVMQELKNNNVPFSFPCNEHKINVIAEIIYIYIFICLHFFEKNEKRLQKSESNKLAKEARLKNK